VNERRGDGVWLLIFLALLIGARPAADAATPPHHKATPPLAKEATPPLVLPGPAARLAPERIYAYGRGAGFSPDKAVTATAIALAESDGRPRAHNPNPPDDSYCLMQINMLGPLGPARRARFRLHSNADLYDPATCMRVAYAISAEGSNWQPWTTYTRGTYRHYLARAKQAGGGR
jgi:Lysozyme like domain